ncbi:hypothetical protein LJY25_13085 [Hymenobacter sp. BT175]|uniref:hypothetical protein n=1 Tax=Hymenobacter translucens TaxID=2886507 RepID=UPI001D0F47CB|nr:hypothetical protein [Hymenobacter translucens]MCC2547383.1 hypothetical protein [Hymenobacter translucens]
MKKASAFGLLTLLLALPRLAYAGEGKEGFFFMFLIGAGGALAALALYIVAVLLAARSGSPTVVGVIGVLLTTLWAMSTYWCFDAMLNPVFVGAWEAEHANRWSPTLTGFFILDLLVAGLAVVLAGRSWLKRRHRLSRQEAIERSLNEPFSR